MGAVVKACRRFTVLDGMILVAATAAGFGFWRAVYFDFSENSEVIWVLQKQPLARIGFFYLTATPIIAAEMIGYLVIRFRKPRARLRRIMGQPGMVACVTALSFLMIGEIVMFGRSWPYRDWRQRMEEVLLGFAPCPVGIAVLVAWVVQALSQRWRCERGWIDSLGTILGLYWIVAVLPYCFP